MDVIPGAAGGELMDGLQWMIYWVGVLDVEGLLNWSCDLRRMVELFLAASMPMKLSRKDIETSH